MSSAKPTRLLVTAIHVAEELDCYVQPRFEILRDKNFGAFRIVYRKHAGIVQLKVDSPKEKGLIANVNAAHLDYAICLLHCAPRPGYSVYHGSPRLQLRYFNQQRIANDWDLDNPEDSKEAANKNRLDMESAWQKSVTALPELMAGREYRTGDANWEILMRPVRASKQECLSCHTNAKPGATLGVMTYFVRKSRRPDLAQVGLR